MAISESEVKTLYPIHWLVWNNEFEMLKEQIDAKKYTTEDLELKDPRSRTPLLLAVTLAHTQSVKVLLDAGSNINCEKDGWSAVQEATATGDAELLALVLSHRDYQRHMARAAGIPDLLRRLSLAPDFYVEMKWEFISWVPLVSRMCPFDTYRVFKRGGNVRVDTTLIGFENNRWQRGDRTYIFKGQGESAVLTEVDHVSGSRWSELISGAQAKQHPPPPHATKHRLRSPLAINYLDTDKICFERNKCGIWGWRQDKTEAVNGYECKVFSANNVELVSKTRVEHLAGSDGSRTPRTPLPQLAGLLALADAEPTHSESVTPSRSREDLAPIVPVSWQEYFSSEPMERDVGRPKEINTKVQKFKATLWLCENYPLELQEQIMPILDLMATMSSPHFVKLKDFIQMQLPAGFPIKIEIPLFHVLNARITFGNIFGTENPVPHIECIQEGDRLSCVIDDACFNIGKEYRDGAGWETRPCADDEESLLQYAIQQSLMEAGTHEDQVDVWEALRGTRPGSPSRASPRPSPRPSPRSSPRASPALLDHEERQLQRAIEASLSTMSMRSLDVDTETENSTDTDPELLAALELSVKEQAKRNQELEHEQRALDEVIRLSLIHK